MYLYANCMRVYLFPRCELFIPNFQRSKMLGIFFSYSPARNDTFLYDQRKSTCLKVSLYNTGLIYHVFSVGCAVRITSLKKNNFVQY